MKKLLMLLIAGCIISNAGESLACHITFAPQHIEHAQLGEVITVEAIVSKDHRRCVLEDTDVQVELSDNIAILNESCWRTEGAMEIHNSFDVQILSEGDAMLKVFRECSKKGISEGVLTFPAIK